MEQVFGVERVQELQRSGARHGKDNTEATWVLQFVPRGSLGTGLLLMYIAYPGGSVSLTRPAFQE